MSKTSRNNKKKKKTGNESSTDIPDIKTNADTTKMNGQKRRMLDNDTPV